MKFPKLVEYRNKEPEDLGAIERYLREELVISLKELFVGLRNLTFADNFQAFEAEVTIGSGVELPIRNQLSFIPTKRMILRGDDTSLDVADGPTAWTSDYVFLKNYGGSETTVTVLFMR